MGGLKSMRVVDTGTTIRFGSQDVKWFGTVWRSLLIIRVHQVPT